MENFKVRRLADVRVDVPEGETENFSIERFTVGEEDIKIFNLRQALSGCGNRSIDPGTYTRLRRKTGFQDVVMSDTPAEIRDHREFIDVAKGNILINGLGIGFVLEACLQKTECQPLPSWVSEREEKELSAKPDIFIVEHVTVVEISSEVIELVASHYLKKYPGRIAIIQADTLTWAPPKGVRYNAVWHDIWDNICSDNLKEMKILHRRYGKRTNWQGSWGRSECEYYSR